MAWSPPHGNSTASSCKPSNGEAKLPEMVGGRNGKQIKWRVGCPVAQATAVRDEDD